MSDGECVKVIVRCRPMNTREKDLECKVCVTMEAKRGQCTIRNPMDPKAPPKMFTFDGAYFVDSTTENIYNEIAYPLVEGVTEGYNGTIFAYGQTGCGKSFTMQGITDPATQRGIIPRSFDHIFETVSVADTTKFLLHASYCEIYNEEIRDLLGKDIKAKLDLKEHPEKGVYVSGLSMHPVHNVSDCEKIMARGWSNRATGATLMNADSSRSHSIFTINIEMCSPDESGEDHIRAGKLNLVDLAGRATGDRLKEATKINLSLSALGNVISALVDGKSKHIPYRDSKLTRLLQDSLGGNTKTLMVACLSPADNNYDETLSTLRYANRAKNITNKPKINEDPKDALLRQYQEEIAKLKAMLAGQIPVGGMDEAAVPKQDQSREELEDEKKRLREEYDQKLQEMKAEYEREKGDKVKIQQDMLKLRAFYDTKLKSVDGQIAGLPPTAAVLGEIEWQKEEEGIVNGEIPQTSSVVNDGQVDSKAAVVIVTKDGQTITPDGKEVIVAKEGQTVSKDGKDVPVTSEGVTVESDGREVVVVAGGNTINEAGQPVVVVNDGQKVMTDHDGHHFVVVKGQPVQAIPAAGDQVVTTTEGEVMTTQDGQQVIVVRDKNGEMVVIQNGKQPGIEAGQTLTVLNSDGQQVQVRVVTNTEYLTKTEYVDRFVDPESVAGSHLPDGPDAKRLQNESNEEVSAVMINGAPVLEHEGLVAPSTSPTQSDMQGQLALHQEEAMRRLQELEMQMVGGENKNNKQVKERRRKRKLFADERKQKLAEAIANMDDDFILLEIYDETQQEVKDKDLEVRAAKVKVEALERDIIDIQSEFQFERIDYLDTIRKQEKQLALLQALLDKVHPCLRRDCNYSNLDKVKAECKWDDEESKWLLPRMLISTTALPVAEGVMPGSQGKRGSRGSMSNGESPVQASVYDGEEDRFRDKLMRKSDATSGYFHGKRQYQLLQNPEPINRFNVNEVKETYKAKASPRMVTNGHYGNRDEPMSSGLKAAAVHGQLLQEDNMVRRPTRLDALPALGAGKKGKKKKGGLDPL
ncbi:hypothetical protein FSP39_005895 [Pinctada imbricata]|uniref:Kinesin motor domain-containing protein n=1 Tax=Pinctada imbricata TaxID=66713 RepID=A0AA88YHV4_PINIB|nr:hypothetical protein FSP39_005895 [Pinctada imbricata]